MMGKIENLELTKTISAKKIIRVLVFNIFYSIYIIQSLYFSESSIIILLSCDTFRFSGK